MGQEDELEYDLYMKSREVQFIWEVRFLVGAIIIGTIPVMVTAVGG